MTKAKFILDLNSILYSYCHAYKWNKYFAIVIFLVTKSCPTLCDPMDCSPRVSSVHGISQDGISQARILEWVAISFSRVSSQPQDQTWVSHTVRRCFYCLSHQGSLSVIKIQCNFKT